MCFACMYTTYHLHVHGDVHAHVCFTYTRMPGAHGGQESVRFPGRWDTGSCEPPSGFWERNSCPLQKQVLLVLAISAATGKDLFRERDRQRERQRQRMEMSLQYYYYTYIIMQCIIIHVICYKYNIIINYINNSIIILLFHHEAEAEGWWIEVSLGYIARPCPHKYSLEMKTTIKSIVILIQQKVHLKRRNCVTF